MKLASTTRTLWMCSFLRHMARSSRDSGWATTQEFGGMSHRSQSLQKCKCDSRGIPWEMSEVSLMQSSQRAVADAVPSRGAPQL